jgi:hypothetical protein
VGLGAQAMTRDRSLETHSGWGAAVVLGASVAGAPLWLALCIGLAAGLAVEAVQWAFPRTGSPSTKDVLYTAIGAFAAGLFALFVQGGP